jgi:hypothetical protein
LIVAPLPPPLPLELDELDDADVPEPELLLELLLLEPPQAEMPSDATIARAIPLTRLALITSPSLSLRGFRRVSAAPRPKLLTSWISGVRNA